MLLRGDHLRDGEGLQRLRLVLDVLDLEPDHGELLGQLVQRLVGVEMFLQPGESEFHGCVPRLLSVFTELLLSVSMFPPPLWGRVREGGKPRAPADAAWRIASTTPSRFVITCSLVKRRT